MSKISLVRKVTMIATTFALALSALSATNVFAASSPTTATSSQAVMTDLTANWKFQISSLQYEATIFSRADKILNASDSGKRFIDGNSLDDESRFVPVAYTNFAMVLGKAQAIVAAHAGFDATGAVTDQVQATQSLQQLSIYLSQLRGVLYYKLMSARNI